MALGELRDTYVSTMTSFAQVVEMKDSTTRGPPRPNAAARPRDRRGGRPRDGRAARDPRTGSSCTTSGRSGSRRTSCASPGRLDEAEWLVMREHPTIGAHDRRADPVPGRGGRHRPLATTSDGTATATRGAAPRGDPAGGARLRDRRLLRRDDQRPSLPRGAAGRAGDRRDRAAARARSSTPTSCRPSSIWSSASRARSASRRPPKRSDRPAALGSPPMPEPLVQRRALGAGGIGPPRRRRGVRRGRPARREHRRSRHGGVRAVVHEAVPGRGVAVRDRRRRSRHARSPSCARRTTVSRSTCGRSARSCAEGGLSTDDLRTPPARPFDVEALIRTRKPSPLLHDCSGNHAGMLVASARAGWSIETYRSKRHPHQRRLLPDDPRAQRRRAGGRRGRLWHPGPRAAVARARHDVGAVRGDLAIRFLRRAIDAMRSEPYLVGGPRREDTAIMQARPTSPSRRAPRPWTAPSRCPSGSASR